MAKGRFVSYLRVSTVRQGASGLGLEAQREAVASYMNGGAWTLIDEFTEVESGKRSDRPQLAAALASCRIHGATLVIAKLDRLARNVLLISTLMESDVDFVAADFPQANRLTVHILAAVAEYEATMTSVRTKAALAAAKARGVTLGGLRGNPSSLASASAKGRQASATARSAKASKRRGDLGPIVESIRKAGAVSLRQIAAELNNRGIRTPRGSEWTATQVLRLIGA